MAGHDEAAIEQEIQAKGLNVPRLNPAHIDATIVGEMYYVFPDTTMTVCLLTLRNGLSRDRRERRRIAREL